MTSELRYNNVPDPEPDRRVVLIRQFVDLESQLMDLEKQAEHIHSQIEEVRGELYAVHMELSDRLNIPSAAIQNAKVQMNFPPSSEGLRAMRA